MDKNKVISHLQTLRTWMAVNPRYGTGLSREDCQKGVEWIDDTLELLKEQEEKIKTLSKNTTVVQNGENCQHIVNNGTVTISM